MFATASSSSPACLAVVANLVFAQRLRAAMLGAITVFLTLIAAATGAAQDGFTSLPAEARDASLAYRKLIAADGGGKSMVSATQKNLEESEQPKSRCSEAARQFCSDLANAQFEFKPLKVLLPSVPRLTPHNVYVRRNKVTVAYTFK